MSKCISSHGEYSEHEPGPHPFVCAWCGVFDEDAAVAEVERLRTEMAELNEWQNGVASLLPLEHPETNDEGEAS